MLPFSPFAKMTSFSSMIALRFFFSSEFQFHSVSHLLFGLLFSFNFFFLLLLLPLRPFLILQFFKSSSLSVYTLAECSEYTYRPLFCSTLFVNIFSSNLILLLETTIKCIVMRFSTTIRKMGIGPPTHTHTYTKHINDGK